jgi:GT2 family glycosyltransferase
MVAPQVTVVVVAHDPGPWFDETLQAIADQDYPVLGVLVVDAASLVPVADRVHEVLPDARVVRLDQNQGYGRSINAVLPSVADSPLLVLAHDDVAPDPTAVRALVEEAFRSNAAIVGPKIVRWDDPRRMLSAGEGADKFGFPVPLVERHELDQEQHDAVRDVFTVPDAFTLVRTDLLRAFGGFDPDVSFFGDDLDLCWRAHVAGARVMVAPAARVRHLEALGVRREIDDRRRLQFRHRMRAMLTSYRLPTLIMVLPQLFVVHLVEAVFALITGRPGQTRDVVTAWSWNARHLGSLRARRRTLKDLRLVSDSEVRSLQVRGSARIAAFMRGQLATGDETFGSAASMGKRVFEAVAGPGRRESLLAWSVVALVLVVGSRHLLTRPIPAIGEFVPFPEQLGPLFTDWATAWRSAGLGSSGVAAPANLVVGVAGALFLGATGLLRTVTILGMFPLGLLGIWRLVAPVASPRASAGALLAYAAVPLGYDALATGSWTGLVAYGIAPWVLLRVVRSSGSAPFGAADGPAGPRFDVPPIWRQSLALGILGALAALVDPLFVFLPLLVWIGLVPGSLLLARTRGLGRMFVVSLGAAAVGAVLHGPWMVDLVTTNPSWSTFTPGHSAASTSELPLTHILRFDTGPIGASALNAAVLVAAAFVMLVGRDWRLTWAGRAWSIAVCCWLLVWVEAMGWLPVALPPVDLILAPAAAALALSVGLGVAAFELDVRHSTFGWRQFASVAAVGALAVALLPVMGASVGGRWLVPRGSHHQALSFLAEQAAADDFRVLWLGDPEVLPVGAWRFDDQVSYATTTTGTPTLADRWPGPPESTRAPLRQAIEVGLERQTNRLGRLFAPMGIRYIVIVDQAAPAPFGGVSRPSPRRVHDALAEQLDLVEFDVNPVLTVYRNDAWDPSIAPAERPDTPVAHLLVLVGQLALVVVVALVMHRSRAEHRVARRVRRSLRSPVDEVVRR